MARRNPRGGRGGLSQAERDDLPTSSFLKPQSRAWPVNDKRHALIALQYMTAGRGKPSEYPTLLWRLAKKWKPARHPDIWAYYEKNRAKIARKCKCKLPRFTPVKTKRQPKRRRAAANPHTSEWLVIGVSPFNDYAVRRTAESLAREGYGSKVEVRVTTEGEQRALAVKFFDVPELTVPDDTDYSLARAPGPPHRYQTNTYTIESYLGQYGDVKGPVTYSRRNRRW